MKKHQVLSLVLAVVTAMTLVVGCGGTPAPTAAPAKPTVAAAQPTAVPLNRRQRPRSFG